MPFSSVDVSLLALLPSDPIPLIHDHNAAITKNFEYYLLRGRIYMRSRTPDEPKEMYRGDVRIVDKAQPHALDWKLLDDIGIPYQEKNDTKHSLLQPREMILEIYVASDIIVAVSNFHKVYLYKPTRLERPLSWEAFLGAPDLVAGPLYVPADRMQIALSCSVCKNDAIRRTDFMHPDEIVGYFSDANFDDNQEGVRFNFGFTLTLYVLLEGGRKIVYWDTGLPPSFSRGFVLPDGLRALSISAAGSDLFIYATDAEGTRQYLTIKNCYESLPICPGLKGSFVKIPRVDPPDGPEGSYLLGHGIRQYPLPGYVFHAVDGMDTAGHVRICLTGQGDKARDLIIAGKNAEVFGYFYKKICDTEWVFVPEPSAEGVYMSEPDVLPLTMDEDTRHDYQGRFYEPRQLLHIRRKIKAGIQLELKNFHPFGRDTDEVYCVVSAPGQSESIRVYTGDAWGMHAHLYDHRLFGAMDGELKPLIGRVVLTEEQIAFAKTSDSPLAIFLKNEILPYHGKAKAITLMADNRRVIFILGGARCHFERTVSDNEIMYSFYMKCAMAEGLTRDPENIADCDEILANNKRCLADIKAIFLDRKLTCTKDVWLHDGARPLRKILSGVLSIVYNPDDPTYQQAANDTKPLFRVHAKAARHSLQKKEDGALGYKKAVETLIRRIAFLKTMKKAFIEENSQPVQGIILMPQ